MKKVVIHTFHDDASSLGTGSHVSERTRQVEDERGVELEVYVFGPPRRRSPIPATPSFVTRRSDSRRGGVAVHVCRSIAEDMGKAGEFAQPGFILKYARDTFVRYALEGVAVVSF